MDLHQVNISLYSWLRADFEPVFKATAMCPNPLRSTNNFKLGLSDLAAPPRLKGQQSVKN